MALISDSNSNGDIPYNFRLSVYNRYFKVCYVFEIWYPKVVLFKIHINEIILMV